MAFERISKVINMPDGAIVWAEGDTEANRFRVVCSACPELAEVPRRSGVGAILAASYHADHDPSEGNVPVADGSKPPWR